MIALYDPPVSEASYAAQRTELRLILFSVSSLQKKKKETIMIWTMGIRALFYTA